jgi:protoporphyrin/coproporphyrin ferrochelatase
VTPPERPAALLMTYGSPSSTDPDDVRAYLARVRGGRDPDPELVDEFTRRYRVIGGSPLIDITRKQATALSERLHWPVEVGMRFSEPSIAHALRTLAADGTTHVAAIILSPQYSRMLMGGYERAIRTARAEIGHRAPSVSVAGAWHTEPAFIEAMADRVVAALSSMSVGQRAGTRVLMTAHSLPRRVAIEEPGYLEQLDVTARAIATGAGLSSGDWTFCWQSAGHEPGEWMKPDFADLMPGIAAGGGRGVLVVPVQFLADHLETLYDVDVGAREQAERYGLAFARVPSLNDDEALATALAAVAERTLGVTERDPVTTSGYAAAAPSRRPSTR